MPEIWQYYWHKRQKWCQICLLVVYAFLNKNVSRLSMFNVKRNAAIIIVSSQIVSSTKLGVKMIARSCASKQGYHLWVVRFRWVIGTIPMTNTTCEWNMIFEKMPHKKQLSKELIYSQWEEERNQTRNRFRRMALKEELFISANASALWWWRWCSWGLMDEDNSILGSGSLSSWLGYHHHQIVQQHPDMYSLRYHCIIMFT